MLNLLSCGLEPSQIEHFEEETDAFDAALSWAEPGDLVIMLALGSASEIRLRIDELTA